MTKKKNYIRSSVGFSKEQYQYLECLANNKQESVSTILREIVSKEQTTNILVDDLENLKLELKKLKEIGLISNVVLDDFIIQFTTYTKRTLTFTREAKSYLACCNYLEALETGYRFSSK